MNLFKSRLLFYLLVCVSFLTMVLALMGMAHTTIASLRNSYSWLALTSGLTAGLLVIYRNQFLRKE
jgi:hypothetical protein